MMLDVDQTTLTTAIVCILVLWLTIEFVDWMD